MLASWSFLYDSAARSTTILYNKVRGAGMHAVPLYKQLAQKPIVTLLKEYRDAWLALAGPHELLALLLLLQLRQPQQL
jgi:hypothetical protein